MLNEREKRREGFKGDIPIVMADGQPWYFPEPRLRAVPAPPPERFRQKSSLGEEHTEKVKAFRDAATSDDIVGATADLAAWMLLRNYDLTYDEIGDLVQLDFSDGASEDDQRMVAEIIAAGLGQGPKRTAVG